MDALIRRIAFVFPGTKVLMNGAWRGITTEGYDPNTGKRTELTISVDTP